MSRFASRFWAAFGVVAVLVLGLQAGAANADPPDFSSPGEAYDVLPPGQAGGFSTTVNSRDQIPLYDGLTPLKDQVFTNDLPATSRRTCSASEDWPCSVCRPSRPGRIWS